MSRWTAFLPPPSGATIHAAAPSAPFGVRTRGHVGSFETLLAGFSGKISKADDLLANLLASPEPVGLADTIRFDHSVKRWLIWGGTRWREDKTEEVTRIIHERVAAMIRAEDGGKAVLTSDDQKNLLS